MWSYFYDMGQTLLSLIRDKRARFTVGAVTGLLLSTRLSMSGGTASERGEDLFAKQCRLMLLFGAGCVHYDWTLFLGALLMTDYIIADVIVSIEEEAGHREPPMLG